MKDFKGKTAVVTGAASGIGRGLADRFAAEGMNVVLADVEQGALDQAAKEMTAAGATVLAVRTDVSKLADIEALAEKAYARFGAVHILCNNAGVGGGRGTWDSTQADWEWVLGVNLWGVINGVRTFVPKMLAGGEDGYIVNTASVAGLIAGAGGPSYTVSKFGVVGAVGIDVLRAADGGREDQGFGVVPGADEHADLGGRPQSPGRVRWRIQRRARRIARCWTCSRASSRRGCCHQRRRRS